MFSLSETMLYLHFRCLKNDINICLQYDFIYWFCEWVVFKLKKGCDSYLKLATKHNESSLIFVYLYDCMWKLESLIFFVCLLAIFCLFYLHFCQINKENKRAKPTIYEKMLIEFFEQRIYFFFVEFCKQINNSQRPQCFYCSN